MEIKEEYCHGQRTLEKYPKIEISNMCTIHYSHQLEGDNNFGFHLKFHRNHDVQLPTFIKNGSEYYKPVSSVAEINESMDEIIKALTTLNTH